MPDRIASILSPQIDGHIALEALPDSGAEKGLNAPQPAVNGNLEKNATALNSKQSSSPAGRHHNTEAAEEVLQYHYLTFDTPLPPPTGISSPASPGQQAGLITALSCLVTTLSAMAAGMYSPPENILKEKWGISGVVYNLGITLFCFGFAISPMVLAPFSEINGRRPMLVGSGILFSVTQLGCAVTNSFAGMLLSRFFLGVGGSTYSSIIGGVLSDIYVTEERNKPMALFSGAVLVGTGLGPMISSFMVYHISWRWVYYMQAILSAVVTVAVMMFFKETRGNVLLSRKAQVLNKWYEKLEEAGYVGVDMPVEGGGRQSQRIRWKAKSDDERESIVKVVTISLYRPFHLLFTEPVVFFFSLWVSFSWAVLYLQFGAIPLVFQNNHGFNLQQSGAVFASISIGGILATFLSIWQEKYVRRLGKISSTPEGRLYFVCIESILMPVGMFWFGWTSFSSIHWVVPCFAIGCATIGIFSIYLAVFNYLADTYHRSKSSRWGIPARGASYVRQSRISGGIKLVRRNWLITHDCAMGARVLRPEN
ncbi:hypothetical protein EMPG_16638 [Blastomyces silverae]|uniref:Major facilitator superfamily (MFS) profile domain-containing protein n=1 Tax=Blastomyces silverae TaxID=2060906 RepID=A0A0H1B947_9EURO|nr:hypothetical protein EMPG_16638 [Blastomyces silverae]